MHDRTDEWIDAVPPRLRGNAGLRPRESSRAHTAGPRHFDLQIEAALRLAPLEAHRGCAGTAASQATRSRRVGRPPASLE